MGIALALPCSTVSLFSHAPLTARTCTRSACARAYDKTRPRVCGGRFCISQHPEVEATLAAELDDNGLLAKRGRPYPRMVSHDDLAKLAYLGRVIKVSMEKGQCALAWQALQGRRDGMQGCLGPSLPLSCRKQCACTRSPHPAQPGRQRKT